MPENERKRFDQRAFAVMQDAALRACADVPELEGVAVVYLWRFPDQASLPTATVVGADGPLVNPDQLLRLQLATLRLLRFLTDASAEGVAAVRELAAGLARKVHEQKARPPGQDHARTGGEEESGSHADETPA